MKRMLYLLIIVLVAAAFAYAGPDEKGDLDDLEKALKGQDSNEKKPDKIEKKTDPDDVDLEDLEKLIDKVNKKEKDRPKGVNPFEKNAAKDPGESDGSEEMKTVIEDMTHVEGRLARGLTDKTVQIKEDEIIENLDKLIIMAEKQEQQQKKSDCDGNKQKDQKQSKKKKKGKKKNQKKKSAKNPQPMKNRDPNNQNEKNRIRKLKRTRMAGLAKGLLKGRWGLLPKKIRDDAADSEADKFDENYKIMIEKYYRKLSKQNR